MNEVGLDHIGMMVTIHKATFATTKEGIEVTITLKTVATPEALELARRVGQRARVNVLLLQRSLGLELEEEEG